jgi:hypothetical protein
MGSQTSYSKTEPSSKVRSQTVISQAEAKPSVSVSEDTIAIRQRGSHQQEEHDSVRIRMRWQDSTVRVYDARCGGGYVGRHVKKQVRGW